MKLRRGQALPALTLALLTLCHCVSAGKGRDKPAGFYDDAYATLDLKQSSRAYRIHKSEQLIKGPQASGQVGDFKIENDQVAFVIDDIPRKPGFAFSGGNLIDAAHQLGLPGDLDALGQNFLFLGKTFPRQAIWRTIRVLPLGSDGAVTIQVNGVDSHDETIGLTQTYTLPPHSAALTMRLEVINSGSQSLENYDVGDAWQWGNTQHFAENFGFDMNAKLLTLPWMASLGEELSYGITQRSGQFEAFSGASWSDVNYQRLSLAPGARAEVTRYLIVGGKDTSSLMPTLSRIRQEKRLLVKGKVAVTQRPEPIKGSADVWFYQGDRPFSISHIDASGQYQAYLPPNLYEVKVEGQSVRSPQIVKIDLQQDNTTHDLTVQRGGTLAFQIQEKGQPLPGKLVIEGVGSTPRPRLGPGHVAQGAHHTVLTATGEGLVQLPPGAYRIFACHGPMYDAASVNVTMKDNQIIQKRFTLKHVVPARGYISADFHQHSHNSYDSAVSLKDRVTANLAEGLEVMVSSDHDYITNYAPVIWEMDAAARIVALVGDEVTTPFIGHFIAFPLLQKPALPKNGALDPSGKSAADIFAWIRAQRAQTLIQVNHPRAEGDGYFNAMHLDKDKKEPEFSGDFDAIEVLNGKRTKEAQSVIADWVNFLNQGRRYTATGNSDSHAISEQEVGYPRNFVRITEGRKAGTQPAGRLRDAASKDNAVLQFQESALVEAIKNRHAVIVSNGPFPEIFVTQGKQSAAVGDTFILNARPPATGAVVQESVTLNYRLHAAPWVSVNRLEVWQDGALLQTIAVKPGSAPKRLEGRLPLKVHSGSYVFVIAQGDKPLDPCLPTGKGRPTHAFALTNPIFFQ